MDKMKTPLSNILESGIYGVNTLKPLEISEVFYNSVVQVIGYKSTITELEKIIRSVFNVDLPMAGKMVPFSGGFIKWVGAYRFQFVSTDTDVMEKLQPAITVDTASIVQLSDARAIFNIKGRDVKKLLAKGASIDFHGKGFVKNSVVLTNMAHIGVMISCIENNEEITEVQLFVYRTFAKSFYHFLTTSAQEYGYQIK